MDTAARTHTFDDLGVTRTVAPGDLVSGRARNADGTAPVVAGVLLSVEDTPDGPVYLIQRLDATKPPVRVAYADLDGIDNVREWLVVTAASGDYARDASFADCLTAARRLGPGTTLAPLDEYLCRMPFVAVCV